MTIAFGVLSASAGEPENLVLNAGNPGFSYIWNTGATTQLIKVNAEGSYHVAVSASGCTANDSIIVSFLPRLTVSILPDTVICKNSSIQLSASGVVNNSRRVLNT